MPDDLDWLSGVATRPATVLSRDWLPANTFTFSLPGLADGGSQLAGLNPIRTLVQPPSPTMYRSLDAFGLLTRWIPASTQETGVRFNYRLRRPASRQDLALAESSALFVETALVPQESEREGYEVEIPANLPDLNLSSTVASGEEMAVLSQLGETGLELGPAPAQIGNALIPQSERGASEVSANWQELERAVAQEGGEFEPAPLSYLPSLAGIAPINVLRDLGLTGEVSSRSFNSPFQIGRASTPTAGAVAAPHPTTTPVEQVLSRVGLPGRAAVNADTPQGTSESERQAFQALAGQVVRPIENIVRLAQPQEQIVRQTPLVPGGQGPTPISTVSQISHELSSALSEGTSQVLNSIHPLATGSLANHLPGEISSALPAPVEPGAIASVVSSALELPEIVRAPAGILNPVTGPVIQSAHAAEAEIEPSIGLARREFPAFGLFDRIETSVLAGQMSGLQLPGLQPPPAISLVSARQLAVPLVQSGQRIETLARPFLSETGQEQQVVRGAETFATAALNALTPGQPDLVVNRTRALLENEPSAVEQAVQANLSSTIAPANAAWESAAQNAVTSAGRVSGQTQLEPPRMDIRRPVGALRATGGPEINASSAAVFGEALPVAPQGLSFTGSFEPETETLPAPESSPIVQASPQPSPSPTKASSIPTAGTPDLDAIAHRVFAMLKDQLRAERTRHGFYGR